MSQLRRGRAIKFCLLKRLRRQGSSDRPGGGCSGRQHPVSQLPRPCPGGKPILHLLRCQTRVR